MIWLLTVVTFLVVAGTVMLVFLLYSKREQIRAALRNPEQQRIEGRTPTTETAIEDWTPVTGHRVKRPLGVTILALLYLFGGVAFLIILSTALRTPAGVPGSVLGHDIPTVQKFKGIFPVLSLIFAGIGAGLWFMQSWARWMLLIILGADLARRLLVLALFSIAHGAGSQRTLGSFFWFAGTINLAMFMYLRLPHVKEAFRRSQG